MNFHRRKYLDMYFNMALIAAEQSVCNRHKVGAVVVTQTGMLSIGYNGMPAGFDNECEHFVNSSDPDTGKDLGGRMKTKPEVIHAEMNAINKMLRSGYQTDGSILLTTRAPCFACSKSLLGLGLQSIFYLEPHDDMSGVRLLQKAGIDVAQRTMYIHGRHKL